MVAITRSAARLRAPDFTVRLPDELLELCFPAECRALKR